MIHNFEDFCWELNKSGFSMGGGNAKGIFALIDYDWLNQDMLDTPVKWHCGDPEVDPWEWRMRVLEERTDIAYSIVRDGYVALHEIKALGGFGKEDKSQFDRAMVELQMGMFITMTGRKQKKNKYGIEYGWNSTVFTTVENFWAERDFEIPELDADESYEKIREQILLLNPVAEEKTIRKFILGR